MKLMDKKKSVIGPVKLSVPKDTYYLCFIRCVLSDVLTGVSIDDDIKRRMVLSLDEACSNLIKHECENKSVETIEVTLLIEADEIIMDIHNFCSIKDVPNVKPPKQSKMTTGGLGIIIIKKCVDKMEFLKKDNLMVDLRLTKKI